MRVSPSLLLLGVALAGCRACQGGEGETDPPDTEPEDTAEDSPTDTAIVVPPRCSINEVEPNNVPGTETPLPLEKLACGEMNPVLDADQWSLTVEAATWVAVDVEARAIGSRADMGAILVDVDRGESAQWIDGPTGPDIHLRWPALPGRYLVALTEMDARGGEDEFFYELLATEVKEPLTWDAVEAEPNNSAAGAGPATLGGAMFGTISDAFDQDWLYVDIPSGKHLLTARADAFEFGSAAQLRLTLTRPNGTIVASVNGGEEGWERDPTLTYVSQGSERLVIKVLDRLGRGGRPYWYVLNVSAEAE